MLNKIVAMMASLLFALVLVCVLLLTLSGDFPLAAHAKSSDGYNTYYVALSGDCGGMIPCFTAVQAAVDAADAPDDIVKVAGGIYTEVNNYGGHPQVVFLSKTLTIRGGYLTSNWDISNPDTNLTILDARNEGRVIYIQGEITPTIESLHITGGNSHRLGGGASGRDAGGGVYVLNATATISNNQILSNSSGGEFRLGFGGGLYLASSNATVTGNTFSYNSVLGSGNGAAVYIYSSTATLNGNTMSDNTSNGYSGGAYIVYGTVVLEDNTISKNTSAVVTGLALFYCNVTLTGNTISDNTAYQGDGGGLVLWNVQGVLDGNIISGNRAARDGGAMKLDSGDVTLINNLIVDNQASRRGSGLYIEDSAPHLLYSTIARNTGGDGSGIYVTNDEDTSNVFLTNTIIASQTVGIKVKTNNTATLEATLWGDGAWRNDTDCDAEGTIVTVTQNYWGNPAFVNPDAGDYHIGATSAAIDKGVDAGVITDIDGDLRPWGNGYDIGADEFVPLAPSVPILLAPPNGMITTTLTVTFAWQAGAGAAPDGYNLRVDGNVITTSNTSSTTILSRGIHSWTVRAYNAVGYSAWASPWFVEVSSHSIYLPLVLRNP